nr:hypothetical protein [Tanacetum cinerariifolium]
MSPANKAHFESEKEAIHMILTGIRDEIYSNFYSYNTTHEMWEAIKRLQQAQPATQNVPAVPAHKVLETHKNITLENHAYFYVKAEGIRMILSGTRDEIDSTVDASLVAGAQHYLAYHNQALKPNKPNTPSSRQITSSKSHATTRSKGKEVVKLVTPPSESAFDEDSDKEHAQMDKHNQRTQPATQNVPAVPAHKVPETHKNITLENHAYFYVKAEGIRMILSGTGDEIDSTVDACQTAQEMLVAIE